MQDLFHIPSCFSSSEKFSGDPTLAAAATRSGHSAVVSVYRAKIAGYCRLITVTWCKNLLSHGFSVSVEGSDHDKEDKSTGDANNKNQHSCKVEIQPWHFWRRHGSKRFHLGGKPIDVFWDLRSAKFSDEPEPQSDYYVAVVAEGEVVLLLGDLREKARLRTGSRGSMVEAILVCRKEHVFGKKKYSTRAKFHEKGRWHNIVVECNEISVDGSMDSELVMKIDGSVSIHVRHLQWKFRGNGYIWINQLRLEVYWDVHDWLFSPGLRHALFIFKPESSKASSTSSSCLLAGNEGGNGNEGGSSGSCLFLYAWRLE